MSADKSIIAYFSKEEFDHFISAYFFRKNRAEVENLYSVAWFSECAGGRALDILQVIEFSALNKDEFVYRQGDYPIGVYFILNGEIEISVEKKRDSKQK